MLRVSALSVFAAITLIAASTALTAAQRPENLRGTVRVDGSSTVYPISEAVAEEFASEAPRVRVTVASSGTGGGFKRFTAGEIDISDASRPIKKSEHKQCLENGVEYIELPIAYDGLSIVVHPENYWVDYFTVEELHMIYSADSTADSWDDIRPDWPALPMSIYSPGTDSGTFDYFKEVVIGKEGAVRSDMSVSEDDNVLVRGVAGDTGAIGFFGCSYYFENSDKLRSIPIENPKGERVRPRPETIESGQYAPFSRPLFIYVRKKSAERPEVKAFVDFYLENVDRLATEVGYVGLPRNIMDRVRGKWADRHTGTHFLDLEEGHTSLAEVYR